MSQPGDISTEPKTTVALNAPCFFEQMCTIGLKNDGKAGVFWRVTPSSLEKYGVTPATGALKGKSSEQIDFKCRSFFFKASEVVDDALTFEWCDTPAGHSGEGPFDAEYFQRAKVVFRHVLKLRFNA